MTREGGQKKYSTRSANIKKILHKGDVKIEDLSTKTESHAKGLAYFWKTSLNLLLHLFSKQ